MKQQRNAIVASLAVMAFVQSGYGWQQDDRVLWRFEIPSTLAGRYTNVATDGTIYTTDNLNLYSLEPDGSLNWSFYMSGGGRPITFGDDGTIYTGTASVSAVNPDGTSKWKYQPPDNAAWVAGPNVGPDGNIYAAQETLYDGRGLGAFAVNAQGKLLWSNKGQPSFGIGDLNMDSEVVFGRDQLFIGSDGQRGHGASNWSFSLDGKQEWFSGLGGLEIPANTFPRMLPDGRVVYRSGWTGLMVVQPDGTVDWTQYHPSGAGNLIIPVVGSDGSIYTGASLLLYLWSLNSDGSTRWVRERSATDHLYALFISPDNRVLIATGFDSEKYKAYVRGYNPNDGSLLWQVHLGMEQDLHEISVASGIGYSPDNSTAYLTTAFLGAGVGHTYLYAIRIDGGSAYELGVSNLVGGEPALFTVTDGTPNHQQFIAYSLRGLGSTPIAKLNVTLDLRKPALVTSGPADDAGTFEALVAIPLSARGQAVWFQAAEMNSTTPVVEEVVR